jgi:glutathione S-transferase
MPPALIPGEPQQRVSHKQIEAVADGVCDAVVLIALEGARPADKRSEAWLKRQHRKVVEGVTELERMLGGREWFTGAGFGLAEVATVCALDYIDFRYPDFQWRAHAPGLVKLHERLSTRPSFAVTMPQPQQLPAI